MTTHLDRSRFVLFLLVAFTLSMQGVHAANKPSVSFDVQPVIACREISTDAAKAMPADRRLVELKIQVSALVNGDRDDLKEYVYQVDTSNNDVEVADFEPKTELASRYEKEITIEKKDEKSKSIGISLKGDYAKLATGTAGADAGERRHAIVRYSLRPPMDAVTASGTLRRGRSVYFKFRSSPQHTLEGTKKIKVILNVPAQWQTDHVSLTCIAKCQEDGQSKAAVCHSQRFLIALFEEGNDPAKNLAEHLSETEQVLRQILRRHEQQVRKRAFPTVIHRLGASIDLYEPRIPRNWTDLILRGTTTPSDPMFDLLPTEVKHAAMEFWEARRAVASSSSEAPLRYHITDSSDGAGY